jgi:predicted CoA-binding protein
MTEQDQIQDFLSGKTFAVIGASRNRDKYGNKVLRAYLQAGRRVLVIHPREDEIEGQKCYPKIADLPEPVDGLSVITPPQVAEQVVEQAAAAGIKRIWMQPGAENPEAVDRAKELGVDLIAGGPCVLVALHYRETA